MSAQRGFAMIAILALVALIAAFLIASSLNRTAADVSNDREDRSMSALRKAKAALIAYAANEQWQAQTGGATPFQPGAFPCPDSDNDGIAEDHEFPQKPCSGSGPVNAAKRVGRFPWKTIGEDDLRDASGERLWYAVSASFLKNTPSNTNVINSDTAGQLTVNGSIPASNVVAIVFAPGEAIQGQVRSAANVNDPANYLEQFNNVTFDTFTSTALPSAVNNDRLLVITQADLMATVEPIVAANIERDVKPLLVDYLGKWNRYPFAMSFASPPLVQSAYIGSSLQTRGLLPVSVAALSWNATVTQIGNFVLPPNPNASTVTSASCSTTSNTVTCIVNYTGPDDHNARPNIRIDVALSNWNAAFADLPSGFTLPYDISMTNGDGNSVDFSGPPWGYFSPSGPPPSSTFAAGTLSYIGWLNDAHDMKNQANITFSVPAPRYLPRLTNPSTTTPNIDWFISNQWYRQTYYAVAPEWVAGGAGNCTTNPCLTVKNLPGPNDKQAILVFTGRALDGQNPHPTGNPGDYLEGENSTPADLIFEHRAGPSPTINDRVVVVAP